VRLENLIDDDIDLDLSVFLAEMAPGGGVSVMTLDGSQTLAKMERDRLKWRHAQGARRERADYKGANGVFNIQAKQILTLLVS
jgi:hypothetical protein